jgi:hypothetical protein
MLKHILIPTLLVLFSGLFYLPRKWPKGKNYSFSQHAATNRASILFYIALFSFTLPPLLIFFFEWFVPTFDMPLLFGLSIALACFGQFGCTLVPEVGGKMTMWHWLLAIGGALCLIPGLAVLIFTDHIPRSGRGLSAVGLIVMIRLVYMMLRDKGVHSHFYMLQALYYGAFFAPIIYITYIR